MAIGYSNLFTQRLKAIISAVNLMDDWYTDMETIRTDINTKFVAASSQNMLGVMLSTVDSALNSGFSAIQNMAFQASTVLTDRTTILNELPQLTSSDVQSVLRMLIEDMNNNSQTVAASTVTIGSVTSSKTNTNAGTVVLSKKLSGIDNPAFYAAANREYANIDSQLSLTSDSLRVVCTADSELDGTSMGYERFTISGKPQAPSLLHYLSKGSGGPTNVSTAQASSIIDLGFDSFTSNVPNGWTVVAGTAGTHFLAETTEVVYSTGSSLEIAGNCELSLNIANITQPLGHYNCGFLIKSDGLVTGATLNIFFEGTGYTTEATGNEISMDATALNAQTSFDIENFAVVLPKSTPSDLTLRIEVTGMSAGKIYLDFGWLSRPAYHDGIAVQVIAGREVFLRDDSFAFDVTNNDSGTYQKFFRDVYGVQLPTSGSPSIAF